jgi:hypothetical protein
MSVHAARNRSVMKEGDTRRSAEQLIGQHGSQAAVVAADKFIECRKACDDKGMAKWVEIMVAIRELSKKDG